MVDAPERLWAVTDAGMVGTGRWVTQGAENPHGNVEYVRADLYEQVKMERDDAKQALRNEIVAHGNTIRGKAERLAGARVKMPSGELCRYIEQCREISNGGEYPWWSRLAEILSALAEPAGEAVTDAMIEAGLEYYAEGGCGGLADHERREVVEAIIEAALAGAKP